MLELDDPVWKKLDDAYRVTSIPDTIAKLAENWDADETSSLFWDHLCHSDTCYGSTYAAVPHLLQIATKKENRTQRLDIALFFSHMLQVAFVIDVWPAGDQPDSVQVLQGLPKTVEEWDRKLDPFRELIRQYENPSRPLLDHEKRHIPLYRAVVSSPVDEKDLDAIRMIETEFLDALPNIREVCECAYRENLFHDYAPLHLLGGIAASQGMFDIAHLCESGKEGTFKCGDCGWYFEFHRFGRKLAYYADMYPPDKWVGYHPSELPSFLDYQEGEPRRADGFIVPIELPYGGFDPREQELLSLAREAADENVLFLLHHYLGRFRCAKCGTTGPMRHH